MKKTFRDLQGEEMTVEVTPGSWTKFSGDLSGSVHLGSDDVRELVNLLGVQAEPAPIPMLIKCPECGARHIDEGEWATKPHHTHSCQPCGWTWRPAVVPTVGVQHLPGFKNEPTS